MKARYPPNVDQKLYRILESAVTTQATPTHFPCTTLSTLQWHCKLKSDDSTNVHPCIQSTNLLVIAYVVGCIQNLQAESLGYGHHSHPVSKEEPADTVQLLIVLLDNFADNCTLAK